MKVITVIGARPQFIKASVVSRAFANAGVQEVLVHTGQHYDANMSDIFFRELEMPPPDVHLGIGGGSHGAMTGRMLEALENVIVESPPDWVLVYGDTNSTLAGALAAAKLHIPVAHVEAGLRSYNRSMPEELNRVVTDHLSSILFAPTQAAIKNLALEGIKGTKVDLVGDVMYDVALAHGKHCNNVDLAKWGLTPNGYLLTTIHRAENTNNRHRLIAILTALAGIARDMPVVLPLHPRMRGVLAQDTEVAALVDALTIIPPVGYLEMVMLERYAKLIATDSGGVQKEAFFHRVPCVTFRDETEWVELVELGWNHLAPPKDAAAVLRVLRSAMDGGIGLPGNPYGDGDSASAIVGRLCGAR